MPTRPMRLRPWMWLGVWLDRLNALCGHCPGEETAAKTPVTWTAIGSRCRHPGQIQPSYFGQWDMV